MANTHSHTRTLIYSLTHTKIQISIINQFGGETVKVYDKLFTLNNSPPLLLLLLLLLPFCGCACACAFLLSIGRLVT